MSEETPGGTILLVEDNEDDVFVMQRTLKKAQITNPLQVATDGQQALDYLSGVGEYVDRERFPLPFVVFLDLKLPYVHGFEVLSWMRNQPALSSVVVIVLTSSAEDRDHDQAYSLGAKAYLVKPPTPEVLSEIFGAVSASEGKGNVKLSTGKATGEGGHPKIVDQRR